MTRRLLRSSLLLTFLVVSGLTAGTRPLEQSSLCMRSGTACVNVGCSASGGQCVSVNPTLCLCIH